MAKRVSSSLAMRNGEEGGVRARQRWAKWESRLSSGTRRGGTLGEIGRTGSEGVGWGRGWESSRREVDSCLIQLKTVDFGRGGWSESPSSLRDQPT